MNGSHALCESGLKEDTKHPSWETGDLGQLIEEPKMRIESNYWSDKSSSYRQRIGNYCKTEILQGTILLLKKIWKSIELNSKEPQNLSLYIKEFPNNTSYCSGLSKGLALSFPFDDFMCFSILSISSCWALWKWHSENTKSCKCD